MRIITKYYVLVVSALRSCPSQTNRNGQLIEQEQDHHTLTKCNMLGSRDNGTGGKEAETAGLCFVLDHIFLVCCYHLLEDRLFGLCTLLIQSSNSAAMSISAALARR